MESYQRKQLIYKCVLMTMLVACVTAVITFYVTYNSMGRNHLLVMGSSNENGSENINAISTNLKSFRTLIDEYYIGDIDEQKMMDETVKGYVNGLGDEYSEYMTASEWEDYQADALGNYVGIGIYMSQDTSGNIVILEPIEESPAEAIGLKSGDIIIEVDGESMIGSNTQEVASKVKGEEGTKVHLKILRGNEYLEFDVERKGIKVYHVKSEMKENQIGYIKLSTFDEGCSAEFKTAFENLHSQGAQKLVIDLRDNTGGLVDEALQIADMIIPKGQTMLLTVDSKESKEVTKAEQEPVINMDMVVLVNGYSASASEILVGALKDNKKATIVGKKTYGKGVIQNVFSLTDGSVLKLTTAEYFTPNEVKINKIGIEPDVEVEDVPEEEGAEKVDEQLNKGLEILQK